MDYDYNYHIIIIINKGAGKKEIYSNFNGAVLERCDNKMDEGVAVLIEKLRQKGYRITPQRIAILKQFVESESHPTVEEVYTEVRLQYPTTSLATVYKTVLMLKEAGEILELGFANQGSRYDVKKPYPHPHLICVRCHKIIDSDLEAFDVFPKALAQKYGFKIINHRVEFYGLCQECQQKTDQKLVKEGGSQIETF